MGRIKRSQWLQVHFYTKIEKKTVMPTENLQEIKAKFATKLKDAAKKFPEDDFRKLFSEPLVQKIKIPFPPRDEADLNNPGYIATLKAKYEEAIKAIDEAVYGTNDAGEFFNQVQTSITGAIEADPTSKDFADVFAPENPAAYTDRTDDSLVMRNAEICE